MNNFKIYIFCFIMITIVNNANAGLGTWTSTGPEGGRVLDLAADPFTPNVFYAVTRGGVFKSTDGSLNWNRINNGISVSFLSSVVHHSSLADVVYVAGVSSVFKSTDGGMNWFNFSTGIPSDANINNLSMSPLEPDTLYLSTLFNGVFKTINGGASWLAVNTGLPAGVINGGVVRINLTDSNRVYTTTQSGLFESTNGGMSWIDVSSSIAAPYTLGNPITNIQFAGIAGEVYLSTFSGIYKSTDNGASFNHLTGPFGNNITINPSNSDEVIVSGSVGVWTSSDGGATWNQALIDFAGNSTEVANSTSVIFDPFNPTKKLAGTDSNGIYLKTSSSATWNQSTSGMNAQTIRGLAIHPSSSSSIYAGIGDVFSPANVSFISTDSGNTWSQSNSGLTGLNFRDIEVDPFTASSVASTHLYAVGRDAPVATFSGVLSDADGGIYKSIDGGNSWSTIDTGIPLSSSTPRRSFFGTVRDMTLDLNSSIAGAPAQILYVAGSGNFISDGMGGFTKMASRIYKSTDAGVSWSPSDTGIAELNPGYFTYPAAVKIVIDPIDANIIYAATFLTFYDSTAPAPTIGNGVWKSTDAGASWTNSSNGIPTTGGVGTSTLNVLSLVVDPISPNRLYASVHDLDTLESQIYKTENSGANWSLANFGIATSDIRDIAIDSSGVVYAAAAGNANNPGGVYRSEDFAVSWQSLSVGLESLVNVLQLRIDETGVNPQLYAGTTQSVHSIELLPDVDIDGVPNDIELNAPNAGDANNDNLQDANQNNVSSLITSAIDVNAVKSTANAQGLSSYVTVEITPISGSCTNLEDVQTLSNIDVPDDAHRSFDFGVLRFEIIDCQQVTVKLTFHGATDFLDPNWDLRIYAPQQSGMTEFEWQTIQSNHTNNQWTFDLIDGQFGDIRPANGRILFQGGVGLFAETIFQNSFE
jgi:photosystem II stability/assembly factor-like uncharacterized protein